jgi:hypothetical protein
MYSGLAQLPRVCDLNDRTVFSACRCALTEMIFLWRRMHPYLLTSMGEQQIGNLEATIARCSDPISNFDTVASALDSYEMKYHELMRHCLINHVEFSVQTRFFSGKHHSFRKIYVFR